jgi:hypothetical protein
MPQTFYIETDEEIISVIGRLRQSSAEENIFVFPKRALVLQSIINLRLFQREAQKLEKKIILVSQDEVGRMLAEKIGIETKNYSEDFFHNDSHLELTARKNIPQTTSYSPETSQEMPKSDIIGSADFHISATDATSAPDQKSGSAPLQKKTGVIRVRNATPQKLTSLNSRRFEAVAPIKTDVPLPAARIFQAPSSTPNASDSERGTRLKNFFSGTRPMPVAPATQKDDVHTVSVTGKKARTIFFVLGAVSLLSLVGVVLFLFLPKAKISVTPYKVIQTADIELTGRVNISEPDEKNVPVRILEKEQEVALTVATTGKSGSAKQKANGTVIIYNNYNTEPQPLVATTRLETVDGKLFRLVRGVTVPGMTNKNGQKEAGAIEAEVIADQTGEEYNIDATTFHIPGFKSSPKYDAFSVKSVKAMTGGGSGGTSDMAMVAKIDLDTAISQAKEKAKEEFLNEARSELNPDEKILEEQMDVVELSPAAVPEMSTIAAAFDYKNTFRVRAFVFSEKIVKEKIEKMNEKNLRGVQFKVTALNITYNESTPNFSDSTLRLAAHTLITMESDINQDALKEALLGQHKDDMQKALNSFPGVKKMEVNFYPQWFVESIPKNKNRVSIIVNPGETAEEHL